MRKPGKSGLSRAIPFIAFRQVRAFSEGRKNKMKWCAPRPARAQSAPTPSQAQAPRVGRDCGRDRGLQGTAL